MFKKMMKRICTAAVTGVLAAAAVVGVFPSESSMSELSSPTSITAEAASAIRRPCSPEQPMLITHIDTWNYADPAKIIALIPEDIKPYVVFNISLSINWDSENNQWLMVQDGYECAKSWLRTCADEGVWCMVQPSSGGQCHFPDYPADYDFETTLFAEFFRDYPNFIGFNYSEQFWGFESEDFSVTPIERYEHFAGLLKLCNKYGGYLNISWCANQWSAPLNPVAMLKRCPEWKNACELYSENLQLEEKYTQTSYIQDVESEVLGAYLSGYCGNYGVRYDETGWTDSTWNGTGNATKDEYRQVTGLPIFLERMALNGATIIDGPELVWADDFGETWGGVKDSEGYTCRNWYMYDQYVNVTLDFFRKLIDGSIRIPSRQEVIDRTKVVIIQDVSSGSDNDKYSTYPTLFEGLYRMDSDGNLKDNHNLYKSSGRYPTIPTVYGLRDDIAKSFDVQINQSEIVSRWSSISAKQEEFNELFPSEYYGNCYAARYENTWVTYNPNKNGSNCGAVLSFKYNTCNNIDVNFNAYGTALINEYSDHIDIFANNFDEDSSDSLVTDTFKISGCTSKPSYTATDTGRNQTASKISESYVDGTYTLTVQHNGPVSISIMCSGNNTNRLTADQRTALSAPEQPEFYTGIRQYEGEFFDTKNVEANVTNACKSGVTGIQGQGFLKFGKNANAAVEDTVRTQSAGDFTLNLRYSIPAASSGVDLYVNGSKVSTLSLQQCSSYSEWKTVSQTITLAQGDNKIEFKANSALSASLYIDNFTVEGNFGTVQQEPVVLNGKLIKNLTIFDTENGADWSICYEFGIGSTLYGDRDLTCTSIPTNLVNVETIRTAGDSKLYTDDLAEFTAGDDITVYVAVDTRVLENMPQWLSSWTYAGTALTSSNDVTFELYKLNVSAGSVVTLGTNGGLGNSANYTVFAVPQEHITKGDLNCDGSINIFDLSYAKQSLRIGFTDTRAFESADIDSDEKVETDDLKQIQDYIVGRIESFQTEGITGEVYMAQIAGQILETEPSSATAESADTAYGTYEKKTIYSEVCKRNKNFNVLVPAGYSETKEYPVLYVLHGYWGNEDALLDAGDSSLKLRQIIGNAISSGEAEDMIVVFPDIYASDTQDACDGLNAKNNAAYDNFINLLVKEIMPYMEQNYSIKTGRENTAITGFSMGGRESLYIGFSRPDLFGYVGAMCPAPGLTADLISDENLKFESVSPYLLMVSAGSDDSIVWSTPAGYHDTMTNNDVIHIWHYVTDGDHGGKTIRPHMYNFVRAIFKA